MTKIIILWMIYIILFLNIILRVVCGFNEGLIFFMIILINLFELSQLFP
jgi:hypothetical protein